MIMKYDLGKNEKENWLVAETAFKPEYQGKCEAIFCSGEVGAEVEISGRNATLQGVFSESIFCQTPRGQALVSVSGDGAKIAGDYNGILAKSTNSPEEGRIVLPLRRRFPPRVSLRLTPAA